MAKFFVGQRVRLVRSDFSKNVGAEGVISHMGPWKSGDILPIGFILLGSGTDVIVKWKQVMKYKERMTDHGPCTLHRLEPILPEGAQPSEFSFTELMDNLGVVMA